MKNIIVNLKTFFLMLKQLKEILDKKQKVQCIFLLLGVFVCAMLETLGVSAVIPFVLVMFSKDAMLENEYIRLMANILSITSYYQLLFATAFFIIIVYIIKNTILLLFQYYQGKIHNVIEKELMTKLYRMFMLRPYSFYLKVNTAEVLRGLSGDITQVALTLDAFINLASETVTMIMIGVFVIIMDPIIAVCIIMVAFLTAFAFVFCFKKKTSELGKKCRDIFYKRSKIVLDTVGGYKEVAVRQKREHFIEEYYSVNDEACNLNTLYLFIMKVPSRAIETVFVSCLLIISCVRIGLYEDNGQFVALIGAMGVAAIRILPSISNIANSINGLIYSRPSLQAAHDNIMQVKCEEEKYIENITGKKANNKVYFKDKVSLREVYFRYENSDFDILDNLNLDINKNESIGVIGESGSGKTTFLDVFLGLLKPQKGGVLLDGTDIEDITHEWAEVVGYVPQTVFLFDDTIRNNIAFGINEDEISDEKVWECLSEAKLDDFVRALPEGLDTKVGERGVRFSGGQRQRIAIARALYHNPQILVLDEATSALDNETEKEVMQAIDGFRGKLTIIIVAHRLSTIINCDRIFRIERGSLYSVKKSDLLNSL